jgi:Kef-type K+ transport system membrane component KefB
VVSLAICLGLAALAERVGLAALVGAFLAGMVLAESRDQYDLERRMEPLFDLLVPFFFVLAGATLDPGALAGAGIPFLITAIGATLVAKLVGCGVGAAGLPFRERLAVGSGMVARAEVTLAVATTALASGDVQPSVFSGLVAAVLVTSLVAPALTKASIPVAQRRARTRPLEAPPEGSGRAEGEGEA